MRSNNTDIFLVYTRVCQLLLLLDCNKLLSASIFSVVRFNWFNKLAAAKYSKFECVLMFFMDMKYEYHTTGDFAKYVHILGSGCICMSSV